MKCEITNVEIMDNLLRKTEDGHWIDADLYRMASYRLHKGLLTFRDVLYDISLQEKLNRQTWRFIQHSILEAEEGKVAPLDYLTQLIRKEQEYCEAILKKDRLTITREEHVSILDKYLEGKPKIKRGVANGNLYRTLGASYTEGFAYDQPPITYGSTPNQ